MAPQLKLKTLDEPTFFNKDMLIGTLIFPFVGTIIGGIIGKSRMEREKYEGKVVGEPSFWNKDTVVGWLLGGTLVGGLSMVIGLTGITGLIIASALAVAGTVAGAYIGGKSGEHRQASEYEEAQQQTIVNHLSTSVSPEVGHAVGHAMHDKQWAQGVAEEKMLAAALQHR